MRNLLGRLATRVKLPLPQVQRTAALFDDANTVPFIARYRKEVTGGLDEVQLAAFRDELNALRRLDERQQVVLRSIEEQGQLNPALAEAIEQAETLQEVEDLYLPYRPRRRTRAQVARERGLEPVAGWILAQEVFDAAQRDEAVADFLSDEVPVPEDAWQGARDIAAEVISDDAANRAAARRLTWRQGAVAAGLADAAKDPKQTYQTYYEFEARLGGVRPHQVLALNRGEGAGVLKVRVAAPEDAILEALLARNPPDPASPLAADLRAAVEDAYRRLIRPAIEREVRRELTEAADRHAIDVFATNLRSLLLTAPIRGQVVLGIDPGFRTGSKLAVADETGRLLETATITPHPPQNRRAEALRTLHALVERHGVTLIAIGNGTASRETEELVAELVRAHRGAAPLHYLIVSEAGASVYSASPLARAELPDVDVSVRGAVSIARRAQDPLAELVKIDPRSIGVGMYQHDVNQAGLGEALARVTESVVNAVGVDVNTASPALLQHVAGLGPRLAERIVEHRDRHGPFETRLAVRQVRGLGEKTFEQAAGFLRVPGGADWLDNTAVHPESATAARRLLDLLGVAPGDPALAGRLREARTQNGWEALAARVGVGPLTLADIAAELLKPGRDPRDDLPPPLLREDVLRMEDLRPGMRLSGTVRNVVDFGAFVDIGVKQDGLIHVSQMADRRVESPYEVVSAGDVVEVTVLTVEVERGRIGLSLRKQA